MDQVVNQVVELGNVWVVMEECGRAMENGGGWPGWNFRGCGREQSVGATESLLRCCIESSG